MNYNTSLPKIIYPDYGRHVQKMVDYACTIEDREERNKAAQTIVNIMANMSSQFRDASNEVKQKLWDQIAIISDFKLDVDYPFTIPKKEDLFDKPKKLPNPQSHIVYKHYGKNNEQMIKAAIEMEDGELKNQLIDLIANHMKRCYLTWNRESVSDEIIYGDLKELSRGKLIINESIKLAETRDILIRTPKIKRNTRRK